MLKQDRYARRIIKETGMSLCNMTTVPMEINAKFSKAPDEEKIDEKEYRRTIGCLHYLLHTRPDLSFSVGVLTKYMEDPKASWCSLETNSKVSTRYLHPWTSLPTRNRVTTNWL